jgi:lysyl-tRNA synthetase class 2
MKHGLPPCSGVAVGLDRILMLKVGASSIEEVLSFPITQA